MDIRTYNRNVRMSARKVRLIADLIRGLDSVDALDQLRVNVRAACLPIEKTLKSALANAEHNFHILKEDTFIKTIMIDQGVPLKRWRARAFGRAAPIRKHSCHITLVLGEKPGVKKVITPSLPQSAPPSPGGLQISNDTKLIAEEPKQTPAAFQEEHTSAIIDVTRTGRHEFAQKNNKETKKQKGFLKRVFNRKSG